MAAPPPPSGTTATTTAAATAFDYLANSLAELTPSSSPLSAQGLALTNKTSRGFVRLDCAAGGELLAWNDATLWVVFLLYLFVGIYVICDYYFVPALEVIGDKLQWSESIQGASLMAAGSSFPEFLTALFGVLFFSDENPGPATNIGSAVFNICIIVSLSILFLPKLSAGQSPFRLHPVAFSRDCGFFVLATVESYIFFEVLSPGELEWLETLTMTATYALYLVSLFVTDRFVQFGPKPAQALDHDHGETLELVPLEATTGAAAAPNFASDGVGQNVESDLDDDVDDDDDDDDDASDDDDDDQSEGERHSFDIEAPNAAGRRRNAEKMLKNNNRVRTMRPRTSISGGASTNVDDILCNSPGEKKNIGATTPMPIAALSIDGSLKSSGSSSGCWSCSKPILVKILHALEFPYKLIFRLTIPSVRLPAVVEPPLTSSSAASAVPSEAHAPAATVPAGASGGEGPPRRTVCTVLTFFISMAWLGVITFFTVDIAEDVSACLGFVLAVGTSLPDCLSSIIVARRGRINMSVSNALGSNVFDLAFCVGFPFFIKSLITGAPVQVGTSEDFLFLISAVILLAAMLVGLLLLGRMFTSPYQAFGLLGFYAVFLTVYCTLFGEDQD